VTAVGGVEDQAADLGRAVLGGAELASIQALPPWRNRLGRPRCSSTRWSFAWNVQRLESNGTTAGSAAGWAPKTGAVNATSRVTMGLRIGPF